MYFSKAFTTYVDSYYLDRNIVVFMLLSSTSINIEKSFDYHFTHGKLNKIFFSNLIDKTFFDDNKILSGMEV